MKSISAKVSKGITIGTILKVADNSKAKFAKVVAVYNYKGVKRRYAKAGIGDLVAVSVIDGDLSLVGKVSKAVIVRQRKEYLRREGIRVKFEDNACVIVKDDIGTPAGTIIRGPIAKEVTERWAEIGKIASIIV
ncbi:50S ribosomal protein L14 [Nanobdella aerobiophila]|uniref:Large ribosomal subunit protein uL14 n=1 Tax=Nanobdella aerobiophila TaxID=2586965 RepID=A0A915WSZ1_9ARCH|nr:uL14 family ribosomal protein [Nanobdella aerobiophila]BBL45805.1 50S ribosomal protein L14 [Nanobdella aerobiophila]